MGPVSLRYFQRANVAREAPRECFTHGEVVIGTRAAYSADVEAPVFALAGDAFGENDAAGDDGGSLCGAHIKAFDSHGRAGQVQRLLQRAEGIFLLGSIRFPLCAENAHRLPGILLRQVDEVAFLPALWDSDGEAFPIAFIRQPTFQDARLFHFVWQDQLSRDFGYVAGAAIKLG